MSYQLLALRYNLLLCYMSCKRHHMLYVTVMRVKGWDGVVMMRFVHTIGMYEKNIVSN